MIWWRRHMETFSTLLALCAGNLPVTGEFPSQRPLTRRFDVFVDIHLNKQSSKQSRGHHCDITEMRKREIWNTYVTSDPCCRNDIGMISKLLARWETQQLPVHFPHKSPGLQNFDVFSVVAWNSRCFSQRFILLRNQVCMWTSCVSIHSYANRSLRSCYNVILRSPLAKAKQKSQKSVKLQNHHK